ncbi:MAG TPA: Gldg family protein, partial [Steroidobacteraceae bacterium]|nr:Gldg family protein [Steroidobacteraceae bacterium]
ESFDQQTGRMREGWAILSQLRELYTVRSLPPDLKAVDKDIDALMVVHPKNLAPSALYAIDQFVMHGGKLLAFVDPHSEQDPAGNPMTGGGGSASSDLNPLFKAWGIEYDANKVIGDQGLALTVAMRQGQAPSRHLGVLALPRASMNHKDVVTANLDSINMMTVGALKKAADAKTEFEPLLTSSNRAAPLPAARFTFLNDPQTLLDGFVPTGETYAIAARVHGKLTSAFPNGAPEANGPAADHLKESAGDANLVVVADTDMLADMMWLRQQNLFGQRYVVAWANNGDFLSNVLDNITGGADLISVRGRQSFFRPFTRVDTLREHADQQLRAKEQDLNRQLQETEQKLTALQASRADKSSLTLTKEQEQEVQNFQQERARVRKELRDVRRSLDVGIERLGTLLKWINIGAIPLVLIVLAIVIAVRRRQRLQVSRTASAGGVA